MAVKTILVPNNVKMNFKLTPELLMVCEVVTDVALDDTTAV